MTSLPQLELDNFRQIDRLNQRGGPTLSFIHLIRAGTLSPQIAGELAALVESGASFLTSALRGGVGKSTLLADLLACLPPGEQIVTTPDAASVNAALSEPPPTPSCFLAHEIGSGHWYAYLWADAAAHFISIAHKARIASCLHADDIDQLYSVLEEQGAPPDAVRSIGLIVFMRLASAGRRVVSVHVSSPAGHRLRWLHDDARDAFIPHGEPPVAPQRAADFTNLFENLASRGVSEFTDVRRALLQLLAPDKGR